MRRFLVLIGLLLVLPSLHAQDALNLPTQLYILRNEGLVERYGLGVEGVSIVSAADDFVLDFGIAPDGNWMAYRTPDGLYQTNLVTSDEVRQIEAESASVPDIRGRGDTLVWSPRSDALAYTTLSGLRLHIFSDNTFTEVANPGLFNLVWSPDGRYLAAETSEGIWWVYQIADSAAQLVAAVPGSNGLTWLSATELLFAPLEGGLAIIDLAAGNAQTPLLDPERNYYLPLWTPQERLRVLVGEANAARLQEVEFTPDGVEVQDAGISAVDPANVRWSPDGSLLLVFQGRVLALIDPVGGGGLTLPISNAAAYSWGPLRPPLRSAQPLPLSATALATDADGITQVWRLPRDGTDALQLTLASNDITEYALARDNLRLAYISNSGLWVANLSETGQEIIELGLDADIAPRWSADNRFIYYRDDQTAGAGIWRYDLETSAASLLIADENGSIAQMATPAADVAALLVQRSDGLYILDTANDDLYSLGPSGIGRWQGGTSVSVVGEWMDIVGLYRFDANIPGEPRNLILPVSNDLELLDYRFTNENTVRVLIQASDPGEVRVADLPITGGTPTIVANAGYITQPRLALDGSAVIGLTQPGGQIVVYDVAGDRNYRRITPMQVTSVRWQAN